MSNPLQAEALDPLVNESFVQYQQEVERLREGLWRHGVHLACRISPCTCGLSALLHTGLQEGPREP